MGFVGGQFVCELQRIKLNFAERIRQRAGLMGNCFPEADTNIGGNTIGLHFLVCPEVEVKGQFFMCHFPEPDSRLPVRDIFQYVRMLVGKGEQQTERAGRIHLKRCFCSHGKPGGQFVAMRPVHQIFRDKPVIGNYQ